MSLRLVLPPGDGPVGDAPFPDLGLAVGGVRERAVGLGLPMQSDCDRPRFAGAATATLAGAAGVVSVGYEVNDIAGRGAGRSDGRGSGRGQGREWRQRDCGKEIRKKWL